RRRSGQAASGRATARQRAVEGTVRVPLGGSVQSGPRPGQGARIPRRDAAAAWREARALLLDVRPAFLLDEDHAGRARLRGEAGFERRGSVDEGDGNEGRRVRAGGRGDLQQGVSARVPPDAMTRTPADRYFDSAGVTLRYVDAGSGEAVVLLHSFTGNLDRDFVRGGLFAAL